MFQLCEDLLEGTDTFKRKRGAVKMWPKNSGERTPDITVVVTSCDRYDLLSRTLESFLDKNTDRGIARILVVEDGESDPTSVCQRFGAEAIRIGKRIGQIAAIDFGYSHVETPFIFHLEDDWEFYRSGFVERSRAILEVDPSTILVSLRAWNNTSGHPLSYQSEDRTFGVLATDFNGIWHGFTFSPGLRRLSDYKRLGSFSRLPLATPAVHRNPSLGLQYEIEAGGFYYRLGYRAVILDESGYVRHIGDGRHVSHPFDVQSAAGRYDDAQRTYDRALAIQPDRAETLNHRGIVLKNLGNLEGSLASFDGALAIQPDYADALNNRGNTLQRLGRFADALASYDKALAVRPDYAEALNNRGNILQLLGRCEEALPSYDEALAVRPDYAEALNNRGFGLEQMGRWEEALSSYDKALAIGPDSADALDKRGLILTRLGRFEEAVSSYDKALTIRPDHVTSLNNRGNALLALFRFDEALASYDKALALRPDLAEALNNRGYALKEMNRFEEALASYDQALTIRPDLADALNNRGNVLQELCRFEEALSSYDQALAIRPGSADALCNRGISLYELGLFEESRASYNKAIAVKPDFIEARFASCLAELPILYADEAEIVARRAAYEQALKALCDLGIHDIDQVDLSKGVGVIQPFYLAYQGRNDRELQARYGSLVCRIMARRYPPAAPAPPPAGNEPVRVGIVSGYFRQHSNWKLPIKGWLSRLDREQFRIFGYHTGVLTDAETNAAIAMCDRFVQGPLSIDRWRAEILSDAPHVLIYPEVGMDRIAWLLAAQRLAAMQCNSWGHPDTSGFPTLDYYLSSELMEPPDGENHYTERLVRLPNLSVYCEPIDPPSAAIVVRRDFGLRSTATVYWCGQSLYKYLPKFDEVFPRIARAAGDCQFAFIEYQKRTCITELFRERLDRAFAAFGLKADDHCMFLPRLDQHEFIAASGLCDVFLDSIGWSGCNSTLESLVYDLPIVTMAGSLMRGRHSMAILEKMGVTETIARTINDYVAIAIRLAADVPWRMAVKADLAASKHRIYRDDACILGLEQFLNHVGRRSTAE